MRVRWRSPAIALTVVCSLCLVGTAAATIVPGRGMAGIQLRMTDAQVRARLGVPLRITRSRGALGIVVTRQHYAQVDVDFERLGGRPVVTRVLTAKPSERTASGVGVGSPMSAVRRLPGAHCWPESRSQYCAIGNPNKPLDRYTMLWIGANGRVTLISVALIVNG